MKKLFKVSLFAIALLIGASMNAQEQKVTFGVKAGGSLSNFGGDVSSSYSAAFGYKFGATIDFALTESVYLQTGLDLTLKGGKMKTKFLDAVTDEMGEIDFNGDGIYDQFSIESLKMAPLYLQVPVHIAYKINTNETTKVVLHAGPYLAYGVGGNNSVTIKYNDNTLSEDTACFGDQGFKRFDAGIGGGVGLELGKIIVDLGYDLGLVNMVDGGSWKNQNASLTLGYKF